jgi:hypothetical protein
LFLVTYFPFISLLFHVFCFFVFAFSFAFLTLVWCAQDLKKAEAQRVAKEAQTSKSGKMIGKEPSQAVEAKKLGESASTPKSRRFSL